ncbi:MAG: GNAT family N-acetyltransferase [Paracoccaceae bacterium]
MTETLTIRPAGRADLAAVDLLLAESYPRLLAADYAPSVLVTALPIISRAQPALVLSGQYFVALSENRVMAAGGWSKGAPGQGGMQAGIGHVRHVVTDYRMQRQGVGRALMTAVLADARRAGMAGMDCLSTLTAERFYASLGFRSLGPVTVALQRGIDFPAVRMVLEFR